MPILSSRSPEQADTLREETLYFAMNPTRTLPRTPGQASKPSATPERPEDRWFVAVLSVLLALGIALIGGLIYAILMAQ